MHVIGLGILSKFSIPSPTLRTIDAMGELFYNELERKKKILSDSIAEFIENASFPLQINEVAHE